MIEAVYLPPDFLENLVPNNFLYPSSCGVIRVELLSKIPLEGSVPEIADTARPPELLILAVASSNPASAANARCFQLSRCW